MGFTNLVWFLFDIVYIFDELPNHVYNYRIMLFYLQIYQSMIGQS